MFVILASVDILTRVVKEIGGLYYPKRGKRDNFVFVNALSYLYIYIYIFTFLITWHYMSH